LNLLYVREFEGTGLSAYCANELLGYNLSSSYYARLEGEVVNLEVLLLYLLIVYHLFCLVSMKQMC